MLASLVAGTLTVARPRLGCVATVAVLLVEALTVFVLPFGK